MEENSIEWILDEYTLGHFAAYCVNGFIKQGQNKFGCTSFAELCGWDCGHYHKPGGVLIVLNTPNIPYLNLAPPTPSKKKRKKILAKIFYPKISQNPKFQTPKNPSITPFSLNPEYPHPPKVFTNNYMCNDPTLPFLKLLGKRQN